MWNLVTYALAWTVLHASYIAPALVALIIYVEWRSR